MDSKLLWIILIFIICQRLIELLIAKSNEQWMKKRGGVEVGEDHHKWFVIVHILFFISIISESFIINKQTVHINYMLLFIFIITQVARFWCIYSLGRFWNTKIIVLPGTSLIQKGPYKYIKHPNYIIVGIELIVIPLLFGAYLTAVIFPILHILLLRIRIPIENKALLEWSK